MTARRTSNAARGEMHSVLVMYCDPDNELQTFFKVTKCQAIDLKLFQAASTEPKLAF